MKLKGKKILFFVADEYEDLELQYPKYRMKEEGAEVIFAGAKEKETYKSKHGYPCQSDLSYDKVQVNDYAGLIIPGGYAPDKMRRFPKSIEITKQFFESNKLVAYICHAGWIPASANIVKGKRCTSFSSIKDDMIHAGAHWVDEEVVVDGNLISSRFPDDLPKFCLAIIEFLSSKGFVA